jgi:glycine cleavage system H lipoate-binding protein
VTQLDELDEVDMLCPFLSESQVRSCRVASVRKLIPHQARAATGRCAAPEFTGCPAFREHHQEGPETSVCPYLQDSLMQYCTAAPVARYVPWSEASVSKCGSGAFHYCDLFLDMTEAGSHRTGPLDAEDALSVPPALLYATNHMWLDQAEDGLCHVGIDALFSRLLGPIERVDFITLPGSQGHGAQGQSRLLPSAVVRAGGADWQIVFPRHLNITGCNLTLRSDPSRLSTDPYGRGWMFAGTRVDPTGLMTGEQAAVWMQEDTRRLNEFVQQCSNCCADGGIIEPGLLAALRREDALVLFNGFLSAAADQFRQQQRSDAGEGEGQ